MSTRRTFVKAATAVGATFTIVPRHVLGRGFTAPSDTLRLGAIGIGGKGDSDITGLVRAGVSVAALCDVDWRQGRRSIARNPDARRFKDYREMLATMGSELDIISVSTPDHMHAAATMAALKLDKPVFTQKPLTRTLGEVRTLMAETKRRGVATQMGNQGHAGVGTRVMREYYDAGAIGEIREIHYWTNRPIWPQGIDRPTDAHNPHPSFDWNLWLGPAPERPYNPAYAPFRWRGWWDYGTGALGDMAPMHGRRLRPSTSATPPHHSRYHGALRGNAPSRPGSNMSFRRAAAVPRSRWCGVTARSGRTSRRNSASTTSGPWARSAVNSGSAARGR